MATFLKPTMAQVATGILANDWDLLPDGADYGFVDYRFWQSAASGYLDNLSDGLDDPIELLDLIAECRAAERHDGLSYRAQLLDSYRREDFDEDYGFADDFADFFDINRSDILAATRSTFGMGGMA